MATLSLSWGGDAGARDRPEGRGSERQAEGSIGETEGKREGRE